MVCCDIFGATCACVCVCVCVRACVCVCAALAAQVAQIVEAIVGPAGSRVALDLLPPPPAASPQRSPAGP